jgi:dinuclear metal center YbgI/SA1388 family protein
MSTVQDICNFLDRFAPPQLAEAWDNVGLLVGDRGQVVNKLMTCLTITPSSTAEAVAERVELIVAHHPLPFKPLKRLTSDTTVGRMLLELIRSGIAVYSPHTAFDSAAGGINQRLAEGLGLQQITPLVPFDDEMAGLGAARQGSLNEPAPLSVLAGRLKQFLSLDGYHVVGRDHHPIQRVAVACGSAGQFLDAARQADCQVLVTGETNFHTCLEAEANDVALLLPGHYASERFAVECLAEVLAEQFSQVAVWASRNECDPLKWRT